MRIVELVNNLEIGGAERMVVDLAHGLQQQGNTVSVVCLRQLGPLADGLQESNIQTVALEKGEGLSVNALRKFSRYLREMQIDVVHTHNPLTHHYGVIAGRMAGVPVVVNTFHGPSNLTGFGKTQAVFEASCLFSDRVVACCDAVDKHLRRITSVAKRKLSVIPNGISLERFLRIAPRAPDGNVVFGMVGRLVPVKDHKTLLQAFADVCRNEPPCRLEILGDGALYAELQALTSTLGIADRVVLHRASLDVPSFLARLDAFVVSSLSEGLPLSLLEAMAAGLPVVGTSVGAIPELVDTSQCGWTCPPGQPKEMAGALLKALHSEDRNKLGMRGREYVIRHHSIAAMTGAYEQLFGQLLQTRANRQGHRDPVREA